MDREQRLREFLQRAMVEEIDSLEIVEAVMAVEESLDEDPDTGPGYL